MIQLTPQSRIFLATEPVDFRKGIDGLAAVCSQRLGDNPLEGAVYVFRNRSGTSLQALTLWRPGLLDVYEATLHGALFVVAPKRRRTGAPVRSRAGHLAVEWTARPGPDGKGLATRRLGRSPAGAIGPGQPGLRISKHLRAVLL